MCSFSDGIIVVKAGMSQEHTLKTMVHEVTHAKLHSPGRLKAALKEDGEGFSRNDIEVQAECTAFLVCDHFGMDTSDYSIPYIMSWGEDEKLTPLTKSLDAILTATDEVIDQMETHLWVDMGIDEALEGAKVPDRSSSFLVPAVYDPSMAVDLGRVLANKTVSALQGMGFRLRYEKPLMQGEAPSIALRRVTDEGEARIEAKLFADADGYLVPDFDSHGTTRLLAFQKGEDEPFFEDGGGNLVDQFRELEKRLEQEPDSVGKPAAETEGPSRESADSPDPYAGCLLADPRAQTLMRVGYIVREGGVATPNGTVDGLIFSNGNGTYRLQVEMVPDFAPSAGSPAAGVLHPHTTALSAYDLTGDEPVKFFEARFDGTIQEQMASLRSNERYQDLRAMACGERKEPAQDPVAYMKRKREERRSQMAAPRNRAGRSMAEQAKPRREHSR